MKKLFVFLSLIFILFVVSSIQINTINNKVTSFDFWIKDDVILRIDFQPTQNLYLGISD